jgi:glutamyl-tRNA reductase
MRPLDCYKIITLTHQQTKLTQIGKFVLQGLDTDEALREQLNACRLEFDCEEVLYLSTCNRVMFFFTSEQSFDQEKAADFFRFLRPDLSAQDLEFVSEHALLFEGLEAIRHLFEVASSINSLVVGEREILRQLREAYDKCHALGLTGDNIRLAMRFAVEAAKEVYSQTRIGEKPVSVVSLAIHRLLAQRPNRDARVLLVGAGQTNHLVAKLMAKHGFGHFSVFNRSIEGANGLAQKIGGKAFRLDELPYFREGFDIMVVCTGATEPIVTPELYRALLNGEQQPKAVVDLSIPNNVHPDVPRQFDVQYTEVEDLRALARENLAFRQLEVNRATEMLGGHLEEFAQHFRSRQIEVALREVPVQIRAIRERAINEVFSDELSTLDPGARDLVERMMVYMERKCIGVPMKVAKESLLK